MIALCDDAAPVIDWSAGEKFFILAAMFPKLFLATTVLSLGVCGDWLLDAADVFRAHDKGTVGCRAGKPLCAPDGPVPGEA